MRFHGCQVVLIEERRVVVLDHLAGDDQRGIVMHVPDPHPLPDHDDRDSRYRGAGEDDRDERESKGEIHRHVFQVGGCAQPAALLASASQGSRQGAPAERGGASGPFCLKKGNGNARIQDKQETGRQAPPAPCAATPQGVAERRDEMASCIS